VQKVTSLWVDPERPDTVIAGTWRRAYRSEDGGKSWTGVFEGMVLDSEVFSLRSVPERPDEIWASTCGWVYRSADRGTTWQRFQEGFTERRTTSFLALPGGRLLAGTVAGLHVSDDQGKSWRRVGDPGISIQAIAVHPDQPGRIYFGTEGAGLWVSTDNAASLYPSTGGMTNVRISSLNRVGDELLVGVTHAGPFSGLHRSKDRGQTFSGDMVLLPPVLDLVSHRGRLFAATERGLFERRGAGWHWMRDLGQSRVEQLSSDGARLAARTPGTALRVERQISRRAPQHGAPRSAVYFGDALWVTDCSASTGWPGRPTTA
jgi:ligand-binding sensor domain-containing protein